MNNCTENKPIDSIVVPFPLNWYVVYLKYRGNTMKRAYQPTIGMLFSPLDYKLKETILYRYVISLTFSVSRRLITSVISLTAFS